MFSKLVGNESAKGSIRQLISAGRIPNSLLFTGPAGVGKKQFAFELARAMVCKSISEKPCGLCSACIRVSPFIPPPSDKKDDFKKVFFGMHPDIGMVVPFNRNLLVDTIRALEKEAHFRPYEGEARVFIVNDAEKLNDEASNALLKTLEEPAPTTFLILVTARPAVLLPTIRSRCQTIRFAPVSTMSIETLLRTERGLSSEDADLVARLTNGSVARALDFDLGQFRVQREAQLANIEKALVKRDRAALVRASEQMNDAKNRDLYEQNLEILETLVRDIWVIKSGSDPSSVRNTDLLEHLNATAEVVSHDSLADTLAEIEMLRQSLFVNINRKSATEALFMKMSA